jgi:histidine triad (HIT) family protein
MALAKEQAEEVKKQLLQQVEGLPNENKEEIKKYIEGLDEDGLEDFLKKNKIQVSEKEVSDENSPKDSKCIFCSIAKSEVPSYKILENKNAVAVLEINPLSKGHVIILPKNHIDTEMLPKTAMSLAQKVAKKIMKKFKADDIKIETSNFMGHAIINVIPLYKDTPLKKTSLKEDELKKIQEKLETKRRRKRKKEETKNLVKEEKKEDISKLPRVPDFRIP